MKEELKKRIKEAIGPMIISMDEFQGDVSIEVPKDRIIEALEILKVNHALKFDFLSDLFGIDNLEFEKKKKDEAPFNGPRFEVVYLLLSLKSNERLQVRVKVAEDDLEVPSATILWRAATWPEREAFDMYGISFKDHNSLKRLLMWDEFPGHPLRKDYPLEGMGEERHLVFEDERM
jgi:NADH-quinone oxidoreductase subunit C